MPLKDTLVHARLDAERLFDTPYRCCGGCNADIRARDQTTDLVYQNESKRKSSREKSVRVEKLGGGGGFFFLMGIIQRITQRMSTGANMSTQTTVARTPNVTGTKHANVADVKRQRDRGQKPT